MEDKIKEIMLLVKKERVLITKLVESDEREDILQFNTLQKMYKEVSIKTDELINDIIKNNEYDKYVEKLSAIINESDESSKELKDYVTFLGLINSAYINEMSNNLGNVDADIFSNEYNMQIYDIYLWLIKDNNFEKGFKNSLRDDLVMKLVNSRALRHYFRGDYETASIISDPLYNDDYNDRNRLGIAYASLMMGQISISDKLEMYEDILDKESFESRKKMLEIEFAAVASILTKRNILIPPNAMDYSDFTENVIIKSSELLDKYNNKKEKEQTKILIK